MGPNFTFPSELQVHILLHTAMREESFTDGAHHNSSTGDKFTMVTGIGDAPERLPRQEQEAQCLWVILETKLRVVRPVGATVEFDSGGIIRKILRKAARAIIDKFRFFQVVRTTSLDKDMCSKSSSGMHVRSRSS